MSNKQALHEFQSRLAARLQSVRATGAMASWLAVEVDELRLLLPLSHAGEIFAWTQPQKVPYTHGWFLGVANLRGGLSGVVDLAAFIAGRPGRRRSDNDLAQCRLVMFNPLLETNCALLVDRLTGLRTMEAFSASASPDAQAPAYFGHVYTDMGGEQWQEINLQTLSQTPGFIAIGV
ncbi:MAG: chemotaxis protein CheW [Ottowia sp.]|nr:chemotaxis protein CheW [Ottowia sp.]